MVFGIYYFCQIVVLQRFYMNKCLEYILAFVISLTCLQIGVILKPYLKWWLKLSCVFYNHGTWNHWTSKWIHGFSKHVALSSYPGKFNDDCVNQTVVLSSWQHAMTWPDLTRLNFWAVVIGVVTTRHSMIRVTNPTSDLVLDSFNY